MRSQTSLTNPTCATQACEREGDGGGMSVAATPAGRTVAMSVPGTLITGR